MVHYPDFDSKTYATGAATVQGEVVPAKGNASEIWSLGVKFVAQRCDFRSACRQKKFVCNAELIHQYDLSLEGTKYGDTRSVTVE